MKIRLPLFALIILYAMSSVCCARIYIFESRSCTTNQCTTSGLASCVAVGHAGKRTCVLTAGHCVRRQGESYSVVGATGKRYPAFVIYADQQNDIACLVVVGRLQISAMTVVVPPEGQSITLRGVLNGKLKKSTGTVGQRQPNYIWANLWTTQGMSGGGVYDRNGLLFGIQSAGNKSPPESVVACGPCFASSLDKWQAKYGVFEPVDYGVTYQQAYPLPRSRQETQRPSTQSRKGELLDRNGALCQHCGRSNCPVCNSGQRATVDTFNAHMRKCLPNAQAQPRVNQDSDSVTARISIPRRPQTPGPRGQQGEPGRSIVGPQGPAGRDGVGATGRQGERGPTGSVNYDQFAKLFFERYRDQLRGNDGQAGPRGLIGVPTEQELAAVVDLWVSRNQTQIETFIREASSQVPPSSDLQAFSQRLQALEERNQRVMIVDGKTNNVLDDENYAPGETIVLDIRRLLESAK